MKGEIYWSEKNFHLCEKRTNFHLKLTMRPSSQNWSVKDLRCSATIHWILSNSSIIINLVYFIQYKFTFHMLKHPKFRFFFQWRSNQNAIFLWHSLKRQGRAVLQKSKTNAFFFYTFHNYSWWTNSAVVLIKYDGDTNTWVYIQYAVVIPPPGGPSYNLAISEGDNILRKKFTNKLHNFSEIWTWKFNGDTRGWQIK